MAMVEGAHWGCFYKGKEYQCVVQGFPKASYLQFAPYLRFSVGFAKGMKIFIRYDQNQNQWSRDMPRVKHGVHGSGKL
jgi:hypothetical protein